MADLDEEVRSLKARIDQARSAQARAEHERSVAAAQAETAAAELREEFGVSTADEARALIERLEAELGAEVSRVRELLAATES